MVIIERSEFGSGPILEVYAAEEKKSKRKLKISDLDLPALGNS
jgi:hypothetical protein